MRGSKIEREHGYIRHTELGMRLRCFGSFKASLQNDKKNRCLVNRGLSCSIDRAKEVISDNLITGRASNSSNSR